MVSIYIPASVTQIGNEYGSAILSECINLERIEVAEDNPVYRSAGNCLIVRSTKTLLEGCKTSVIPDDGSVTTIGYKAFEGISTLTSIVIPDSVTVIVNDAFYMCTGLEEVSIGDGVKTINSSAFDSCTSLKSIVIPDQVKTINSSTFYYCTSLESIMIPKSVTLIYPGAFIGCSNLSVVHYAGTETEWNAINLYTSNNDALVNAQKYFNCSTGGLAFELNEDGCSYRIAKYTGYLTEVVIPATYAGLPVTQIGKEAFLNCEHVTSVSLSDSITTIEYLAFANCSNLTVLTIPDSVISIGSYAFSGCDKLVQRVSGVGYVGAWAVDSDSGITSAQIRNGTVGIASSVFYYASKLTNISLPYGLKYINSSAVANCSSLTSVTIPSSIVTISRSAFAGCSNLSSISLPSKSFSLDSSAFGFTAYYDDPKNWTGGEVEEGGLYIGTHFIMLWNYNQTRYTIKSGTVNVAAGAFSWSNVRYVTVPSGVQVIDVGTFAQSDVTTVELPSSIKEIKTDAFYEATALKYVYYKGTANDWNNITIDPTGNQLLLSATICYNS